MTKAEEFRKLRERATQLAMNSSGPLSEVQQALAEAYGLLERIQLELDLRVEALSPVEHHPLGLN